MKLIRFGDERIIGILKEQHVGSKTVSVCRKRCILDAKFYERKAQAGSR